MKPAMSSLVALELRTSLRGCGLAVAAVVVGGGQRGEQPGLTGRLELFRGWRWPEANGRATTTQGPRSRQGGLVSPLKVRLVSFVSCQLAVAAGLGAQAAAAQVFDYWWRVLIRSMSRVPWNLGGGP